MTNFKVGDKVRCIDVSGMEHELNTETIYTVNLIDRSYNPPRVSLEETSQRYNFKPSRFELSDATTKNGILPDWF